MSEGEWRTDRQFTVLKNAEMDGLKFLPGEIYYAKPFGKVGYAGRNWTLSADNRRLLLDIIVWGDAPPPKISPVLQRLIKQDPESPLIRPFVELAVGSVPERSETPETADKWMEFINTIPAPVQPAPTAGTGTSSGVFTTTAVDWNALANTEILQIEEETRSIRIEARREISGQVGFSRNEYYQGEIEVPVSVLARGSEQVLLWITDNLYDYIDPENGDTEYYEEEVTDTGRLRFQDHNISLVVTNFNRQNPERVMQLQAAEEARQARRTATDTTANF